MTLDQVKQLIKTYPDFPQKGIQFKDISPALENPEAFSTLIDSLAERVKDVEFEQVIGIDARGFIFGAALAYKLGKGFIMSRKANKLPGTLLTQSYSYEYAEAELTLQNDRIKPGAKYLLVDDVLATGSTLAAVAQMIKSRDGIVSGMAVVIELPFLKGREKVVSQTTIADQAIYSLFSV